jgi:signal transduction histidine kinase
VRGEIRSVDVVIMVADQGIGISPEDLIPLFEKYFRVRSPSNCVSGTGLGLPIARDCRDTWRSNLGREQTGGTTIYFSLPLSRCSPMNELVQEIR